MSYVPIPWKDREGFKRYFSEIISKHSHLTTQHSVRQAAYAESETVPSPPIRYPTINPLLPDEGAYFGFSDEDDGAHFRLSADDDGAHFGLTDDDGAHFGLSDEDPEEEEIIPVITEGSSPNSIFHFGLSDEDPGEEIIPVITEGSSSPNSIFCYSATEGTFLSRTKKNPSPHVSTDASTEEDEAASFGEAKKKLHRNIKKLRYSLCLQLKRMRNKRRWMMNKRKRMMNKSRNFPYRSSYLSKRKACTA